MNNTQITTQETQKSALGAMAARLQVSEAALMKTLKATVFSACRSDEEFMALVMVSNEYQLNPITKEIYAFPGKGGGVVPMVSIDGWLKIMNRQPSFDGLTAKVSKDGEEATATIYIKGRTHPVEVTEYLSECIRPTEPWKKSPKRMLRHKATIQVIRVAFGIGGVHDEDEARDVARTQEAQQERNVTPQATSKKVNPFPKKEDVIEDAKETPVEDVAPVVEEVAKEVSSKEPKGQRGEARIVSVETQEGETNGREWKRYDVVLKTTKQEITATTFSTTVGSIAEFNVLSEVTVWIERTEKGFTLNKIEVPTEGGIC